LKNSRAVIDFFSSLASSRLILGLVLSVLH
jgi:hypothetical protein